MSTGISISSINRIKELAEEKKFAEALEILDTQNLDKSINPQFLRISGEIFRKNKRYYDSRKILLRAHQMAPQGNRIIRELIELYLELGYFTKANKYYEQYMFYATAEDTQKEYVEYIMKKATGSDIKDLAAILIPILETIPGDQWNFEAILLYHKMDRKDMALEESRYILENFKDSIYVQPVIDYIDDKLDVDEWFYCYPKEEITEDEDLYGDLIELEEKLLHADYLLMHPPEARIMVDVEDKDAIEVKASKEKKRKKSKKTVGEKSRKKEDLSSGEESQDKVNSSDNICDITNSSDTIDDKKSQTIDSLEKEITSHEKKQNEVISDDEKQENTDAETLSTQSISEDERVKKEREDALEKILSRKLDKARLKESAQQAVQSVKNIDTTNAKMQIKSAMNTVKDNVKKASDVFGEAVGAKTTAESLPEDGGVNSVSEEMEILDGIIESVLEPPKKVVGQVVMNEELDALIPDSLEAVSEQEVADIEARKEEMERLELEALEAAVKLEEEKKVKRRSRRKSNSVDAQASSETVSAESVEIEDADDESKTNLNKEEKQQNDIDAEQLSVQNDNVEDVEQSISHDEDKPVTSIESDTKELQLDGISYAELKSQFMEIDEVEPLDSLGFITVVHSDVDQSIENDMPDAAELLRQMIDNKEFYSGENSLGFESQASYENHGFEIEDYDFEYFKMQQEDAIEQDTIVTAQDIKRMDDMKFPVEEIYIKESVVAFEDIVVSDEYAVPKESLTSEDVEVSDEYEVQESLTTEDVEVSGEYAVPEESLTSEDVEISDEYEVQESLTTEDVEVSDKYAVQESLTTEDVEVSGEYAVPEESLTTEDVEVSDEYAVPKESLTTEDIEVSDEYAVPEESHISEEALTSEGSEVSYEYAVPEEGHILEESLMSEEILTSEELVFDKTDMGHEMHGEEQTADIEKTMETNRKQIMLSIVLSEQMESLLLELKESR